MTQKKAYYYVAEVFPHSNVNEPFEYFKAYSKKQIEKHLRNNGRDAIRIFDPAAKPVHGTFYEDITEVFV